MNQFEDTEESWLLNLQEFLETLQPQIDKVEALTVIEEFLLNLESTDPNFHRYNFIAQIRDLLDLEVSPLIDNIIKDSGSNEVNFINQGSSDTLVTSFDKILTSKTFQHVAYSINESVQKACKDISKHLKSDTFDFSPGAIQKYNKHEIFNANASVCSTTDGMDYLFMAPEKYIHLARDINQYKDVNSKIRSLSILQQVPQADLVASEAWEEAKKGISKSLDDENEEVHTKALKFISRLFLPGSSHVVREYFLILVENLVDYFTDSTSHFIFLNSGLDLGDRRNVLLLKKFQLLNNIQKEMPITWLRYSEKYVQEVIDRLVYLLGISPSSSLSSDEPIMSPLMFLSVVDPQASWFRSWMHGFYSRMYVINSMRKYKSFVEKPLNTCVNMCKNIQRSTSPFNNDDTTSNDNEFVYTCSEISYTYFLHSINFLHHLLLYKDSRELLNFELKDGNTMSIADLMNVFVEIVIAYPNTPHCSLKSLYHVGHVATEIFRTLANAGVTTVRSCLSHDRLYESFIQSLQEIVVTETSLSDTSTHLVMDVLAAICVTNIGCQELLKKRNIQGGKLSVLDALGAVFFHKKNEKKLPSNILVNLLLLCQRLSTFSDGLLLLGNYDISGFLHGCYKEQKGKTNSLLENIRTNSEMDEVKSPLSPDSCPSSGSSRKGSENVAYKKSVYVEKQILDTILHLALTPKGVSLCLQTYMIDTCTAIICNKFRSKEKFTKTAKNGYGIILNHLAGTRSGIKAIVKSGYTRQLLEEVWLHIEGCINNYTLTVLDEIPQDLSNRSSKKLFTCFVELLGTFNSVRELFVDEVEKSPPASAELSQIMNESTRNVRNNGLKCFSDIVSKLILLDSVDKVNALFHPEESHLFALNILGFMVTSLDSMLCLQAQFHFQEALLKLQAGCQHDNNRFVIDQCSVKRNQILVQSYLLGGPNERKVPTDSLVEDREVPYPWPLFCTYPVPGVYSIKGFNPAVGTHDNPSRLRERLAERSQIKLDDVETRSRYHEELKDLYAIGLKTNTLNAKDELLLDLLVVCNDLACTNGVGHCLPLTKSNDDLGSDNRRESKSPSKKIFRTEEQQAIEMVVRYGLMIRQLRSQNEGVEGLKKLLVSYNTHFHQQVTTDHVVSNEGFDWFAAVIFLLFSGDDGRAWLFLEQFSSNVQSFYLWPTRVYDCCAMTERQVALQDIHPIFEKICHYVEYILEKELPHLHSAFKLSGYPPAQICLHWIRQCFINYLDWCDIVWYITSCIVLGIDYQVYFCIAIFKHLENEVLVFCQRNDLVLFLRNSPIIGFQFSKNVEFMKTLESRYRDEILQRLIE